MSLNTNRAKYIRAVKAKRLHDDQVTMLITLGILFLVFAIIITGVIIVKNRSPFGYDEIEGGYSMRPSYKLFCPNFEGEFIIPENYKGQPVIEVHGMSSYHGRGITRIVGSKNLMRIDSAAFASRDRQSMNNLTEVVFPQDGALKEMGAYAFDYSTALETVVLPSGFEYFGPYVFARCYKLKNLVIYNPIPPTIDTDLFNDVSSSDEDDYWHTKPDKSFTVFVPDEAVEVYQNSQWGQYNIKPISEATFIS